MYVVIHREREYRRKNVNDEFYLGLFDIKCFFGTFFKVAKAEGVSEGGPSGTKE